MRTYPIPPADEEWTLGARWVFPADRPPLFEGRVTLRAGRIVEVGTSRAADLHLGHAALVPGFVNAHTHLDLSGLRGRCPPTPDLPAWLGAVRAARHAQTPEQVERAIADGIAESLRFGTTLVGDIAANGTSWPLLRASPLRAVVFYELLGLTADRAERAWELADAWLDDREPGESCRPGLSPHAPYSVRDDLFTRVARLARVEGIPVAIHLAESAAELELLRDHGGPFRRFLEALNVWDPSGLVGGPAAIIDRFRGDNPVALVHANYLTADTPIAANQTVVYCPRTHAAFGHTPHPFRAWLDRGVPVALGTDSLASNPDLDLLAEARFVHERDPDLPGDVLLRMLTLHGATALGWADHLGSLTPAKYADIVVLRLPDENTPDPFDLLWRCAEVDGVMIGGAWVSLPSPT
jgi:cytosine/adenosine deaminase-related metal-dependent hydrolase